MGGLDRKGHHKATHEHHRAICPLPSPQSGIKTCPSQSAIRDPKSESSPLSPSSEIRDPKSEMGNRLPQSSIRIPKSEIRNPKSPPPSSQSAIRIPKSESSLTASA